MLATLIADDLTGACDAGALFSGAGPVGIATDGLAFDPNRDVVAADTETRALDAGQAAKEVWDMARHLAPRFALGPAVKKLDSTLRGQVAAELDAMLLATGLRAALVCPAFPGQGRTVVDGILRVDGILAHESPIGQDPFYPGPTSSVIDIAKDGTERTVAHLRLSDVRWDHEALCRACWEKYGHCGHSELANLPPGTYTIEAWHEKLGPMTQSVTIGAKESKDITFSFKPAVATATN